MKGKSALLVGATGLVGSNLLNILLASSMYEKVTVIGRKSCGVEHDKLTEKLIDFEDLESYSEFFQVDDVFCCLGTTIKKAKSKEAFKIVDVNYPTIMAELSKKMGASKFLIVTAMGANKDSQVFYNRMKGLVEENIKNLNLKSLQILRPSLLLGKRKEFRLGEEVASIFLKPFALAFIGPLKKYKPISARTVANAMYNLAQDDQYDYKVYQSDEIFDKAIVVE